MRFCRSPDSGFGGCSRGIALIAVLWFVVLLSLVTTAFMSASRGGIHEADGVLKRARAETLADSGVELAVLALLEPAHHEGLGTDGTERVLGFGADRLAISIQDVGGRIDLNEADETLLRAVFLIAGLAEDRATAIAAAIVDWRDADSERLPAGAEAEDYRRAGLPHCPANRPFYSVSELHQVLGMDRALYARVSRSFTIYSGSSDVDVSVAPPPVLAALRQAGLEVEPEPAAGGGSPVNPARKAAPRRTGVQGAPPLLPSETDTYAIRAEAVLAGGGRFVREAVVILTGDRRQPYTVQAWETPAQ